MKNLLTAIGIAALAASPAFAAEMDFSKVDANADGKVTIDEAKAAGFTWTQAQLKAADADGDGALNAAEFKVATAT